MLALQRTAGNAIVTAMVQRSCPQGKQPRVVHNDCAPGAAADRSDFIRNLTVTVASQEVVAVWGAQGSRGHTRIDRWPCSPHPRNTPRGFDTVGIKCSVNHTNLKKDGMAWFTGFQSHGARIGFHNSQPVGTGIFSHGCVRVSCSVAETINRNSASGITRINVI
jgi:hypothetical protein